jgi:hypothetical protein
MLADDKNLNGGKFCLDYFGYRQAIHVRHRDVEKYYIRLMLSDFKDGISSVDSLANNFDIALGTKNQADAAADAFVVIYDEHTKYAFSHSISGEGLLSTCVIRMNSDWS